MASLEGWNITIMLCPHLGRRSGRGGKLPRPYITAKRFLANAGLPDLFAICGFEV